MKILVKEFIEKENQFYVWVCDMDKLDELDSEHRAFIDNVRYAMLAEDHQLEISVPCGYAIESVKMCEVQLPAYVEDEVTLICPDRRF